MSKCISSPGKPIKKFTLWFLSKGLVYLQSLIINMLNAESKFITSLTSWNVTTTQIQPKFLYHYYKTYVYTEKVNLDNIDIKAMLIYIICMEEETFSWQQPLSWHKQTDSMLQLNPYYATTKLTHTNTDRAIRKTDPHQHMGMAVHRHHCQYTCLHQIWTMAPLKFVFSCW